MPTPKKPFDFNTLFQNQDIKADLQIKTVEDLEEKALRLKKDFLGFLFKEIGPYALAALFVVAIGAYCLVALVSSTAVAEEKQWARATLSLILAGVVGVVFGKATK